MSKAIIINTAELIEEFNEIESVQMSKPVFEGRFDEGSPFQIQVLVTTEEDEFIETTEQINGEGMITAADIEAWKSKAEKWDALDAKISKYYQSPEDEDYDADFEKEADENGLIGIGEAAAAAFGYL